MKSLLIFILIIVSVGVACKMAMAEKPPTTTIAEDTREITQLFREQGESFKRIRDGLDDLYCDIASNTNNRAINRAYKDIEFCKVKIGYIEYELAKTEDKRVHHRKLHNEEPKTRQQEYDDIEKLKAEIEASKQQIIELKAEGEQINLDSLNEDLEAYDTSIGETEVVIEGRLDRLEEIDRERILLKGEKVE